MFFLKKFVTPLFYPLGTILIVLGIGLILLWFTKQQRLGKILVSIGFVFLVLLGFDPVSKELLRSLDSRYPPVTTQALLSEPIASVHWVVVLSGGHTPDARLPRNAQLSRASLARVVEGIRLHRALPESRLLLSGGTVFGPHQEADTMARVADLFGVDKSRILLEVESRDTAEQAQEVAQLIGREPFLLVTSASHLPRAMALFAKQGLSPIPAPTDFLARESEEVMPGRLWPNAGNLYLTQMAIHEYLGIVWGWVRGEI